MVDITEADVYGTHALPHWRDPNRWQRGIFVKCIRSRNERAVVRMSPNLILNTRVAYPHQNVMESRPIGATILEVLHRADV